MKTPSLKTGRNHYLKILVNGLFFEQELPVIGQELTRNYYLDHLHQFLHCRPGIGTVHFLPLLFRLQHWRQRRRHQLFPEKKHYFQDLRGQDDTERIPLSQSEHHIDTEQRIQILRHRRENRRAPDARQRQARRAALETPFRHPPLARQQPVCSH